MKRVGITVDGKIVIGDIAKEYFQEGLPLGMIFDLLQGYNAIPHWPMLYDDMKQNGMTHDRIIHLLNEHIVDSYGKEFRDVVISRLEQYNLYKQRLNKLKKPWFIDN